MNDNDVQALTDEFLLLVSMTGEVPEVVRTCAKRLLTMRAANEQQAADRILQMLREAHGRAA